VDKSEDKEKTVYVILAHLTFILEIIYIIRIMLEFVKEKNARAKQ
jgi:hypothetical protein